MITQMSQKISSFFVANQIIKQEDSEVYQYSVEVLLSTIFNFIAIIVISVLTKHFIETLVYLLGFIPMRRLAGGYHAKNHLRCFFVLLFTYSIFLTVIIFFPVAWVLPAILLSIVISIVLIFILAPVEDANKPLTEEESQSFRKKSCIAVLIYTTAVFVTFFGLKFTNLAFAISLGVVSVALSLLASVVRNRVTITNCET